MWLVCQCSLFLILCFFGNGSRVCVNERVYGMFSAVM